MIWMILIFDNSLEGMNKMKVLNPEELRIQINYEKEQLKYWQKKKAKYKSQKNIDMANEYIEWEKKEIARLETQLEDGIVAEP